MRIFLGVIAGLVALVLGAYLVVNGVATFRAHQLRDDLTERVGARIEESLPVAEERQQQLVATAGREPDAAWIEQTCRFDSDDAGWMVQSYREVCTLRSVTAWQVGSETEARALVPVAGEEGSAYDGCLPLGTTGEAEVTWVDAATSDGEPWCVGALDDDVRVVRGDRAALDADRMVLVVDGQPLVDEAIGCAHWSVLFCDNPFGDRHAFADVPAQ